MDGPIGGTRDPSAANALRRELYWAPPPTRTTMASRLHGVPLSPLAARWRSLAGALRWEYDEMFPPEPLLRIGSGMRLRFKRIVWRYTRPISRRYDRIAADLAELGFETAQALNDERAPEAAGASAGVSQLSDRERIARLEALVAALRDELDTAREGALPQPPDDGAGT